MGGLQTWLTSEAHPCKLTNMALTPRLPSLSCLPRVPCSTHPQPLPPAVQATLLPPPGLLHSTADTLTLGIISWGGATLCTYPGEQYPWP